jgi:hypothetical protein
VSYTYGGFFNPSGPIFAGESVFASASLGPPTAVYSYSQNGLLSDATIVFTTPEPAALTLAVGGVLVLAFLKRCRSKQIKANPLPR